MGPKYKTLNNTHVNTGEPSIRIHVVVKRDTGALLPGEAFEPEIGGFKVDVLQRNYMTSIEGLPVRNAAVGGQRHDPLQPGISVSHRLCPSGTLGLFVHDDLDDSLALLTNWHVLADSSFARVGDPVMQPAAMDGGMAPDTVATLQRWILGEDGDAAIAKVNNSRPTSLSIRGLDKVPVSVRDPVPGELVVKSGRSTNVTVGRVEGRGTYFPIYRTRDRVAVEGFEIVPADPENTGNLEISANGDSGAAWLAQDSTQVVGLHFAGERDPDPRKEIAIACFATRVFRQLSISLPA
jgi:endonuclease G